MIRIKKRQLFIIMGTLLLVGAILLTSQFFKMDRRQQEKDVVEAKPLVSVFEARPDTIVSYIQLTGRVLAKDKISIFAEVGGTLLSANKPFEPGVGYDKGELLVKIEDKEAFQNLKAQKSSFLATLTRIVPSISIDYPGHHQQWEQYLSDFKIDEPIPPLPEVEDEQFRLYLTGNNVYTQYNNVKRTETRFKKYQIYAPFDGTLTSTRIEEGSLVRAGQNLGEFMKTGAYELEAGIGPEEKKFVRFGAPVNLKSIDKGHNYQGKVIRINDKVNPQTQTIKIFIQIRSVNDLQPGSYMSGRVEAEPYPSSVKIDKNLIIQNHYLYTVDDSIATLHTIEIKHMSRDSAIVQGLKKGMIVINEQKPPSFEGTKVNVEQ